MTKLVEVRKLSMSDLRGLCIKENWCTMANNEEYSDLLDLTNNENLTTQDIYDIAVTIYDLSDIDEQQYGGFNDCLENIMFILTDKCHTFITIE